MSLKDGWKNVRYCVNALLIGPSSNEDKEFGVRILIQTVQLSISILIVSDSYCF